MTSLPQPTRSEATKSPFANRRQAESRGGLQTMPRREGGRPQVKGGFRGNVNIKNEMNSIHFRQVVTTLGGIDDDGLYLAYCPLAAYYASGSKHRIKSILE